MTRARRRRLSDGFGGAVHLRGILLWAGALSIGIFCVWQHVYSADIATEIHNLKDERADLVAEIGFLGMECSELSSRERVEAYATTRLGMRYPAGDEIVWLRRDERQTGADVSAQPAEVANGVAAQG